MLYFESNVSLTIQIVFSDNLHSHIVNSAEDELIAEAEDAYHLSAI